VEDDWSVIKRRRNSTWLSVIGDDMSEADAKVMAADLNRRNDDLGHYFVAEQQTDES